MTLEELVEKLLDITYEAHSNDCSAKPAVLPLLKEFAEGVKKEALEEFRLRQQRAYCSTPKEEVPDTRTVTQQLNESRVILTDLIAALRRGEDPK